MGNKMFKLTGRPASPGIARGEAWITRENRIHVRQSRVEEDKIPQELEAFQSARAHAEKQLLKLIELQSDETVHEILEAQIQIINDPEIQSKIESYIRDEQFSAEYSIFKAYNEYIELLDQSGQSWAIDRSIDITSVRDSMIRGISGEQRVSRAPKGAVIFTEELSPADLLELHQAGVSAIIMQRGGITSHAVILAQSFGIPCIIGVTWREHLKESRAPVIADADAGELFVYPTESIQRTFQQKLREKELHKEEDNRLIQAPNKTGCGTSFILRANVEFLEELPRVGQFRAEGIGLLRTEALFLQDGYFDTEKHLEFYNEILEKTGDQPVTIRLLDIGGDKLPGYDIREANPFLGWRGIRVLLDERRLLEQQLRSILRAAAAHPGRVRILVPMVSDLTEFEEFQKEYDRVASLLEAEGVTVDERIPAGLMVEVPAIALKAHEAAQVADFFSIGSNDLTQYTLAADRGNERVASLYQTSHPAVWRLIKMACEAADQAGIPIHVCGEIAGKPPLAAALLGMGIRELSMNPASIPGVKKVLCRHKISDFKELLASILDSTDGAMAEEAVGQWFTNAAE
ncbi:MAG: phosphoenolpyruvate--protein phosphotransferase [Balneolaceae bacterium]